MKVIITSPVIGESGSKLFYRTSEDPIDSCLVRGEDEESAEVNYRKEFPDDSLEYHYDDLGTID